jgi:hypothetical protein
MTTAQLNTIKTDIITTHASTVFNGKTLLQLWDDNDTENLARYYNTIANPQLDLWRPDVQAWEATKSVIGSVYVGLTAVKQNGFLMYITAGIIDATSQNVRDSFSAIFPAGATLNNLIAVSKKPATNGESLFIGVVQSGAYVSSIYGYMVSGNDIYKVKNPD